MTERPEPIRILAPESFRNALSRRSFLQIGGAAAGAAFLAACGGGDDDSGSESPGTTAGSSGTTAPAGTSAPGSTLPAGEYSEVINKASGTLAMFTWGEYNDPLIVGSQAESELGVTMKVDYYPSNEEMITKLSAANGNSGFDIVVPTGPYIPQMLDKGLLQKLDKAQLPNIVNVDPYYLGRSWDPGNDYSVCKNWGSTGWMYNKSIITREIATWQDFIDACMNEGSGRCAVLDSAPNLTGMYFWANGINWTTEDPADLDACETFLVDEFAEHIKGFDSYPSTAIAQGAFDIAMMWNGDARATYGRLLDAGGDPEQWVWGLGAPATELWMDTYCIPTGAPNPEGAHAWINWLLTPAISIQDLQFHGYNSGLKDMPGLIAKYAPDLTYPEMIFFSDEQVEAMQTGEVNSAQDRLVEIYDKVKAKIAG